MPSFQEFYFTSSTGMNRIRALKCLPDGEPKAIVQIAHGIAEHIDRYRELSRRSILPLEEALCEHGLCIQEVLEEAETRAELRQLLQSLGEPNREILVRRFYYNQKPREIALAVGLTVTQVNNSLYRSKRQLRRALAEKGVGVCAQ